MQPQYTPSLNRGLEALYFTLRETRLQTTTPQQHPPHSRLAPEQRQPPPQTRTASNSKSQSQAKTTPFGLILRISADADAVLLGEKADAYDRAEQEKLEQRLMTGWVVVGGREKGRKADQARNGAKLS